VEDALRALTGTLDGGVVGQLAFYQPQGIGAVLALQPIQILGAARTGNVVKDCDLMSLRQQAMGQV
jgi:hypothetical protein